MNILFAIKKDVYSAVEPLGILYLSSVLKQNGHYVFLSDSSLINITKFVKEENIGLLGISCMNTDYKYYLDLSRRVKKKFPKVPIIWGGPTATFNPDIIKERGIDIICRGEGEIALLELANRLDQRQDIRKIPNLWIKSKTAIFKNDVSPFISDLDTLPFPDRSLIQDLPQFKYSPIKVVMASRGCPFNCSFCFNHNYHQLYLGKGKIMRTRGVENVIRELEELKKKFNTRFFYFMDDVFPYNKQWLSDFTKKYSCRVNTPFTIVTSVVFINESFVKYIKKAGCVSVHLAIECGNEKIRMSVLNKLISNKQIIKACKILKKHGLSISAYNMVGIPLSTFENELETLDINLQSGVDATYVSFCLPFLSTELGKRAKDAGLISTDTEFLSWFERIPIQIKNQKKVEKFAALFPIIIFLPFLRSYLLLLLKIPFPLKLLKLLKDLINGYTLKRKIITAKTDYKEFFVTAYYFISKRFTK